MSRIAISLSEDEREKLRQLANSWDRSEANMARVLLREALANAQQLAQQNVSNLPDACLSKPSGAAE